MGFIASFVIGGLSGVMTASAPRDLQLTDTYFVVAHLHYVLVGGAMFPLFGAFCYWYPTATGRMMSERWGVISFALIVLGFDMGWGTRNMVATIGSYISALGGMVFVANAFFSMKHGDPAGPDPGGGSTLEWAAASPPPAHNFDHIPVADHIAPLWQGGGELRVMSGMASDCREVLVTSAVEGKPLYRQKSPKPSIWPLIAALAP